MRETKKVTTPTGKEVEIKTYITARERNQLRAIFLEKVEVDPNNGGKISGALDGKLLERSEQMILEVVVTSYDGSAENIAERILDSTPAEYDFIVGECNKVGNLTPAK